MGGGFLTLGTSNFLFNSYNLEALCYVYHEFYKSVRIRVTVNFLLDAKIELFLEACKTSLEIGRAHV